MSRTLSKSRYITGLQCEKRLWLKTWRPQLSSFDESTQRIFSQGTEVGELAHQYFDGGVLVDFDYKNPDKAIAETEAHLQNGETRIFEAAFKINEVLIVADVIERFSASEWCLIEVKSSTRVTDVYIEDLALQQFVMQQAGLKVGRVEVMHVTSGCPYEAMENFFTRTDVTAEVKTILPEVGSQVEALKNVMNSKACPDVSPGVHCKKPYACDFYSHCWQGMPEDTIYDIPNLSGNPARLEQLEEAGIVSLADIPQGFPLSSKQRHFVDTRVNKKVLINRQGISKSLASLSYPLYFLDFEADNPAIPRFPGHKAFRQYAFQYSLHILESPDGELQHREFLHTDATTDPQPELLQQLLEDIGEEGSIIVWNRSFEKLVLKQLAIHYPEHKPRLNGMVKRLFDLMKVYAAYYEHLAFKGSYSIKKVLQVICPELSYDNLKVSGGANAQVAWNKLIASDSVDERKALEDGLLAYCERDTLAMVELYRHLITMLKE
ncbi:MAG: DUF2779 domain-containing protein [Pseudomonadales bacterium]|nr:DUF2779 domain-containing protein [Pseudomonadales bacterium]